MYVENEAARKRDEAILNQLPGYLYTIEADGEIPDNSKTPLVTTQAEFVSVSIKFM